MSYISDNHVFSYSQLSLFNECPFSFYLKYIDKSEDVSNAYAEVGTVIHSIIDDWAKGNIEIFEMPIVFEERWADKVVSTFPRYIKSAREKAYQQCEEYISNFSGFEGYEILESEYKFETEIDGNRFIGIIDMILKDKQNGKLIILDHKSKSLATFRKESEEMYKQQLLYAKGVKEKYGCYPDVLAFNLFKENGLIKQKDFSEKEYNETIEWAIKTMNSIKEYDMLDWMECKKKDFFCTEICSSRTSCPNGM